MQYLSCLWLKFAFKPPFSFILLTHLLTRTDTGICGEQQPQMHSGWPMWVSTGQVFPIQATCSLLPTLSTHRWLMVLQTHGWACQKQGWAVKGAIVWSFCGSAFTIFNEMKQSSVDFAHITQFYLDAHIHQLEMELDNKKSHLCKVHISWHCLVQHYMWFENQANGFALKDRLPY